MNLELFSDQTSDCGISHPELDKNWWMDLICSTTTFSVILAALCALEFSTGR